MSQHKSAASGWERIQYCVLESVTKNGSCIMFIDQSVKSVVYNARSDSCTAGSAGCVQRRPGGAAETNLMMEMEVALPLPSTSIDYVQPVGQTSQLGSFTLIPSSEKIVTFITLHIVGGIKGMCSD